MSREETINFIKSKLDHFNSTVPKIAMLLVVTLQTDDIEGDYEQFSVKTAYTSDKELDEMIQALQSFVDYTDVSYGEEDFIKKVQRGDFEKLIGYEKVVYSESTPGLARSTSALIPALCELYQFKYCSNDIFTDALLDNKMATWGVLKSLGIKLPSTWFYYHKIGWLGDAPIQSRELLICKPAYGCASMGIDRRAVAMWSEEYSKHIHELSLNFDQPMMVQTLIEGYEVEAPVFDLDTTFVPGASGISMAGKQELGQTVLTYDTVFEDGFELYSFDDFNPDVALGLKEISKVAYSHMMLKGPVRFDYRVTSAGELFLMDYNNTPHLGTQHSFAFVITHLGFSYPDMLKLIIYPAIFSERL